MWEVESANDRRIERRCVTENPMEINGNQKLAPQGKD